MLYALKRHPLPIVANFDHCLVLTYSLPAEFLQTLLPPGLEVDRSGGDGATGFLAVAMVQTRGLRPAGLPECVGRDFFLTGYRIFTRFRTPMGRQLRGLRILRSDANRRLMVTFGNLLTHYHYRPARIECREDADRLSIHIETPRRDADLHVVAELNGSPGRLPRESCFRDQRAARRYAGPLPYTFDYEPETHSIVAIRGVRRHWHPRLVNVEVRHNSFLERPPFHQTAPRLAAAFHLRDVAYRWERGVRYELPGVER